MLKNTNGKQTQTKRAMEYDNGKFVIYYDYRFFNITLTLQPHNIYKCLDGYVLRVCARVLLLKSWAKIFRGNCEKRNLSPFQMASTEEHDV